MMIFYQTFEIYCKQVLEKPPWEVLNISTQSGWSNFKTGKVKMPLKYYPKIFKILDICVDARELDAESFDELHEKLATITFNRITQGGSK